MPATGTPEPGGLSWYGDHWRCCARPRAPHEVVAADVVELSPLPGHGGAELPLREADLQDPRLPLRGMIREPSGCRLRHRSPPQSQPVRPIADRQLGFAVSRQPCAKLVSRHAVYEVYCPPWRCPTSSRQATDALEQGHGADAAALLVRAAEAARADPRRSRSRSAARSPRRGCCRTTSGRRPRRWAARRRSASGSHPPRLSRSLAPARPARHRPRRAVARHRASRPSALKPGGARPRFARHRPRPLRARALLPPGRRHRDRPRAHRAGGVGAARGGRPAAPGDGPLALAASRSRRKGGSTRRWRRCGRPSGSR